MRRAWLRTACAVAGAVALVTTMTACVSSGGAGGGGAGSEVTYGLIDDFTGPAASVGLLDKKATTIYVDALNKKGGANGHKIKLVAYDNKSDPALTTTLATRLISQDHAAVITCCATSDATAAAAAVAGRLKTPIITSAVEESLTSPDKPWYGYLFRAVPANDALAQFNVNFMKAKGWKRVALDTTSLSYGTEAVPFFKKSIAAAGASIVARTSLDPTTTDASVQAAQIIRSKADVVQSWDYPGPVAQLVKALRASGSTIPVISNWSAINPAMSTIAGDKIVNLFAHDTALPTKPMVKTYAAQWKAMYHSAAPITDQGIYGYTDAQVAAAAIGKAKTANAAGITSALQGLNCVPVIMGQQGSCITFGKDNYDGAKAKNFVVMKTLSDGTWVPVSS